MPFAESTLLALLPILLFGLVAPELFLRLKMPYITSLILIGAAIGPFGFDFIHSNEVVQFFGFLGFAFLMLLSGLETDTAVLKPRGRVLGLAAVSSVVSFAAGFAVTWAFGHGLWAALVVGAVCVSSSAGLVVPCLRSYVTRREGEIDTMVVSVVMQDIASVLLIAIVLQSFSPITALPLPQYFAALVISVLFLRRVVPKLARRFFDRAREAGQSKYERELRFVILLMVAVLIFFSFLGVHPIVAAFLTGLLLSRVTTHSDILGKLYTIGYGLFVPVFLFIVGLETDVLSVVADLSEGLFVLALIVAFFIARLGGGYLGGRISGMSGKSATFFSLASMPQLATALAAAYAAYTAGIIDSAVLTAVVALSVVTTLLSPALLNAWSSKLGARVCET